MKSFFVDLGMLNPNAVNQEVWNSSLEHFTIRLLLVIPMYSLGTFGFYFKKSFSFTEHLISNTYIRGELNLFMIILESLLFISSRYAHLMVLKLIFLLLLIIYTGWSYMWIFNEQGKKTGLLKGIFVARMAASPELISLNFIIAK